MTSCVHFLGLSQLHGRESWVGVIIVSWLYKTERLPSSCRILPTRCPLVDALNDRQSWISQNSSKLAMKCSVYASHPATLGSYLLLSVLTVKKSNPSRDFAIAASSKCLSWVLQKVLIIPLIDFIQNFNRTILQIKFLTWSGAHIAQR